MKYPKLKELPGMPIEKLGWPWTEELVRLYTEDSVAEDWPKISVVMPSFNQRQYIEESIRSVLLQHYPNLEYIIIDGRSTDKTKEVIKKYEPWISYWVSEKDSGQANAINKGFKRATGEIIGWLNSDDIYMPGTFIKVANTFDKHKNVEFIFSHCHVIDDQNNIIDMLKGKDPLKYSVLDSPNFIPQPTVFFKDIILKKTGLLNEDYNLVMDIDYWRRIYKKHKMMLVNDVFASFRKHASSKTTLYSKRFRFESKKSYFKNGGHILSPYYFETFIKPFLLLLFIYNPLIAKLFFRKIKKPHLKF